MPITTIDGMMLRDMFMSGAALLEKNRQNIDALNVFPVPDGDTGTNMCHTISSAMKELATHTCPTAGEAAAAVARGALKGARGNSGVILSQIFRGMSRALEGADEVNAALFAQAIRFGADTAYKAVMRPKEGTILTVARVVAEEVEREARRTSDLQALMNVVVESGDAILKKTPEMLPVLKQAGVVDSGGKGLMVFFAGFRAALFGEPVEDVSLENLQPMPGEYVDDHDSLDEITFAYCTEFIVSHPRPEMKESDVARLRRRLGKIGDCVLVIGDLEVVKVHVHTNDPGKALQMALELGELDSIKIDNMLEEFRERQKKREEDAAKEDKPFAIVAVALGDGLASLFKDLGVEKVVDGGQTMNPSIEDLVEAIDSTHAKEVFVLPNNSNIILAAQQAAELTERKVYVLPTKSVPMGLSAAIAFSESATGEENEAAMREAAEMVHTASITYAVRDTTFNSMDIHQGDIMGMIDNKINCLGHDVTEVARELLDKMVTEDSELISIYYGADTAEADAQALFDEAQEKYPDCDVEVHMGGQPLYYYLIAVQ